MKRVLVTGGGGYIGSCVVNLLVSKGYHPVVFDTFYWGQEGIKSCGKNITTIKGDIRNSKDVINALKGVDSVIHLAGIVGEPSCSINFLAHHTTNVESTHTLVNCMTHPDLPFIKDLIYCSSCSVYGNVAGIYDEVNERTETLPLSEYADGKLKAEQIIMEKARQVPQFSPTIMRLTTIFGWSPKPRLDLVTNLFVYQAIKERKIKIFGDGSQYRSLIHVKDVANGLVHALDSPRYLRDRQVFHIGEESNNITVKQLASYVADCVPGTEIEFIGGAPTDRRDYKINCQKIKNTLNWKANLTVLDGIKEMAEKMQDGSVDLESKAYRNNTFAYE